MANKGSFTKSEHLFQNTTPIIYETFMEEIISMLEGISIDHKKWDITYYPKAVRVWKKNNTASIKIDTCRNVVHEDSKRQISKLYKHDSIHEAVKTASSLLKLYLKEKV